MAEITFKVGDKVTSSGNALPIMGVTAITGDDVQCEWQDKTGEKKRETFHFSSLKASRGPFAPRGSSGMGGAFK